MNAREAFKTWRFWSFTIAFFIAIVAINGTLTQIVALLTDRGIPAPQAIGYLSTAGLALIVGRLFAGWCLDRFWGPYVAICFFIIPMAGIALLASGAGGSVPMYGAILCGLGVGAEVDLMAFFTSRYFGMRDYAKIYGVMFALFAGANGVGPSLSGASFDHFHSYVRSSSSTRCCWSSPAACSSVSARIRTRRRSKRSCPASSARRRRNSCQRSAVVMRA